MMPEPADCRPILNIVDLANGAVLVFYRYGPLERWLDPDIAEVIVLRDQRAQGVETQRPMHIPPLSVSWAAWRAFTSAHPTDDHDLATDARLARWWKQMADLGLLPTDYDDNA